MASCYPTGCTPCDGEITFPENPTNGQRHCVPIGSSGETKCWVYDHCVPGWRAEGPAVSPTRYRGLIDVCSTGPAADIQAGDWYIASADCDIPSNQWFGLGSVKANDRIIYSGVKWETLAPPNVPYASDAIDDEPDGVIDSDGKPDPDERTGGIVKLATVKQAKAGTDKCDVITPFTLQKAIGVIDLGAPTLSWLKNLGTSFVTCPGTVVLEVQAQALLDNGSPGFGLVVYQWYKNGVKLDDSNTVRGSKTPKLTLLEVSGSDKLMRNLFTPTPLTAANKDKFKVEAMWIPAAFQSPATNTPLMSVETTIAIRPMAMITTQPSNGSGNDVGDTGTFSVDYQLVGSCDDPCPNQWTVEWFNQGKKINDNDVISGITFSINGDDLDWEITGAGDGADVYVRAAVTGSYACNGTQLSDEVKVKNSAPSLPANGTVNFVVTGESAFSNSVGFSRVAGYFDASQPNISPGSLGFAERDRREVRSINFWADAVYKLTSASSSALLNQTRITDSGKVLRFEDIPGGGDNDYNDIVITIPAGGGKFQSGYNGDGGIFYLRTE